MTIQYVVRKGPHKLFASTRHDAKQARRTYRQLRGARITEVLQARPDLVKLNTLYNWYGEVPA